MWSARKIRGSLRLVIRRVFEGGVGSWKAGMPDRSMDIGDRDLDNGREEDGELSADIL